MRDPLSRRVFMKATAAALLGAPAVHAATRRRPNIVFIIADDLGYGDLGCYGSAEAKTPAIDSLAQRGVKFTQMYCAAPECSPTRTALMTGRYPQRVGGLECAIGLGGVGRYDDAIRLAAQNELGLPPSESVLARSLKEAGYRTAICGKWHLGYDAKFLPKHHGFDHWFGPIGGACDYFHHVEPDGTNVLYENDRPVKREGYLTDLISEEAVKFVGRQQADSPFFLYVAYTAPHAPYQGPGDKRATPLTDAEWNEGSPATYAAMIEALDRGVGRILRSLAEKGVADNTLVVFTSDNGANKKGRNAPWSGHKGGLYEGGIRAPALAQWPGVLQPGRVTEVTGITMDWTVSLLAAAGAALPTRALDGVNILANVRDGTAPKARPLVWRARRGQRTTRAVRDGTVKYIAVADARKSEEFLFDLASDPAETTDLKAQRPADLKRLKAMLEAWERDVKPPR